MSEKLADTPLPTRDADHTVKTIVETGSGPQTAWLQLFLPRFEDDTPFFRVVSDTYQLRLDDTSAWDHCDGTGDINLGESGGIDVVVHRFVWQLRTERHFAKDRLEAVLWGIPLEMTVRKDYGLSDLDQSRTVIFSLSPNRLISPWVGFTRHFDGQKTYSNKTRSSFALSGDTSIEIDTHFDWLDDNTSRPKLVAEVCGDVDAYWVDGIHEEIDDAVLVLSLLTGTRMRISQMAASQGAKSVEHYRPRFGFPRRPAQHLFEWGLIDRQHIEQCFETAWQDWRNCGTKRTCVLPCVLSYRGVLRA